MFKSFCNSKNSDSKAISCTMQEAIYLGAEMMCKLTPVIPEQKTMAGG